MIKRYLFFLCFAVTVISTGCNNGNATNSEVNKKKDSVAVTTSQPDTTENKRPLCANAVKDFLKWYKVNYEKINKLQNGIVTLIGKDTASQYRVNTKNAEKYMNTLRASGFFSEKFFENKSQYFKAADENLIKEKQNDGPPAGFESDLILYTQEPEAILNKIDSWKLDETQPGVIKLIAEDHDLLFHVNDKSEKCVFDEISFGRK